MERKRLDKILITFSAAVAIVAVLVMAYRPAQVRTGKAVNVTPFSADLSLRINGKQWEEAGIKYYLKAEWDTYHEYTLPATNDDIEPQRFSVVSLRYLIPGTKYYYRSYVRRNGKLYCGKMRKFVTPSYHADVTTGSAIDITSHSARIGTKVRNTEKGPVEAFGIIYSRNHDNIIYGEGMQVRRMLTTDDDGDEELFLDLNNLHPASFYYYCSFANYQGHYSYGTIHTLTTADYHLEAVDLGLSVCWASHNLGAENPDEKGGLYAWDNTEDISKIDFDAACKSWGSGWRIPSADEMTELIDNCTWEPTTFRGTDGMHITGRNGNSIFLPLYTHRGTALFRQDYLCRTPDEGQDLYHGLRIRPVKASDKADVQTP